MTRPDHSTLPAPVVIVEQLNRSQWHAVFPDGGSSGVSNWTQIMTIALLYAGLCGAGVESTSLNGEHLVFVLPEMVR